MNKTTYSAALLLAGALLAGNVFAESPRQPQYGDVSADGQYVYRGLENGWQLKPYQFGERATATTGNGGGSLSIGGEGPRSTPRTSRAMQSPADG